jgi:hypothetical protein
MDDDDDDFVPSRGRKASAAAVPESPSQRTVREQREYAKRVRAEESDYRAADQIAARLARVGALPRPSPIAMPAPASAAAAHVELPLATRAEADEQRRRFEAAFQGAAAAAPLDPFACITSPPLVEAMRFDMYVARLTRELSSMTAQSYTVRGGRNAVDALQMHGLQFRFAAIVPTSGGGAATMPCIDLQLRIDKGMDAPRAATAVPAAPANAADYDSDRYEFPFELYLEDADPNDMHDGDDDSDDDAAGGGGGIVIDANKVGTEAAPPPSTGREYRLEDELVRRLDEMTPQERERANISELPSFLEDRMTVHTVWQVQPPLPPAIAASPSSWSTARGAAFLLAPELLAMVRPRVRLRHRLHRGAFPDAGHRSQLRLVQFYYTV